MTGLQWFLVCCIGVAMGSLGVAAVVSWWRQSRVPSVAPVEWEAFQNRLRGLEVAEPDPFLRWRVQESLGLSVSDPVDPRKFPPVA